MSSCITTLLLICTIFFSYMTTNGYGSVINGINCTDDESITNGGFESGDLTGWSLTDLTTPFVPASVSTSSSIFGIDMFPSEGNFAFFNGFDGSGPDAIELLQSALIIPCQNEFILNNNNNNNLESYLTFDYELAIISGFSIPNSAANRTFSVIISDSSLVELERIMINEVDLDAGIGGGEGSAIFRTGILSDFVELTEYTQEQQAIFIEFEWFIPEQFTGPGSAMLDNIKIECCLEDQPTGEPTEEPTEEESLPF